MFGNIAQAVISCYSIASWKTDRSFKKQGLEVINMSAARLPTVDDIDPEKLPQRALDVFTGIWQWLQGIGIGPFIGLVVMIVIVALVFYFTVNFWFRILMSLLVAALAFTIAQFVPWPFASEINGAVTLSIAVGAALWIAILSLRQAERERDSIIHKVAAWLTVITFFLALGTTLQPIVRIWAPGWEFWPWLWTVAVYVWSLFWTFVTAAYA